MARAMFLCLCTLLLVVVRAQAEICARDCRFELVVRMRRSMTYTDETGFTYNVDWNSTAQRLQVVPNTFHQSIDLGRSHPSNISQIGRFLDSSDVITTDGFTRNIYVINGQFPGPTLEVLEGAEVRVTVTNLLFTSGLTVHFHGQHFKDNLWMDGPAYVTQCPILPLQSFEYKFIADPAGTFFYHGHLHNDRVDGLSGAFIVHPRVPLIPHYVMTVQDWYHEDALTINMMNPYRSENRGTGENQLFPLLRDFTVDGGETTSFTVQSTLIDGRGRMDERELPLASYTVVGGARYRFHVINSATEITYEIMLDSHELHIVSLDVGDINTLTVDSFIIGPGERVDFEIETDETPDLYWLRAEVLRHGRANASALPNIVIIQDGVIKGTNAILRYDSVVDNGEPSSSRRECSSANPCRVFNCYYPAYRADQYKTCLTMADAESSLSDEYLQHEFGVGDTEVEEYFLNWGFHRGPSVNARSFVMPNAPFSGPNEITPCDEQECATGCHCTHILDLPYNKTIQLVMGNIWPIALLLSPHAIHLHGHSFAVMKLGFPDYNETTGVWTETNNDVLCDTQSLCARLSWNGQRPTFYDKPVVKDTIVVPPRGYAVLRFRTNNPGYWLMHCHQDNHADAGMAMALSVAPERAPPVPAGFPVCGDFRWQTQNTEQTTTESASSQEDEMSEEGRDDDDDDDDEVVLKTSELIGAAVGFTVLGALLATIPMLIFACCSSRNSYKP